MAAIFDDDFESYSVGTLVPTGFTNNSFFNDSEVVDFGTAGFFGRTGKGYHLFLGDIINTNTAVQNTTVVYATIRRNGRIPNVRFANTDGTHTVNLLDNFVEPDGSLSLYSNVPNYDSTITSTLIANSLTQEAWENVWAYHQINLQMYSFAGTGTALGTYVGMIANYCINGVSVCGGNFPTNQLLSSLPLPLAVVSQWGFRADDGYIDDIYGSPINEADGFFPHPGTPKARVSQGVLETLRRPATLQRAARLSQGVVEIPWLPDADLRSARVTQGVVEILHRPRNQGWRVYEA